MSTSEGPVRPIKIVLNNHINKQNRNRNGKITTAGKNGENSKGS